MPRPFGELHLKLRVQVDADHRRALAARLEREGLADARTCETAITRIVERYLEALKRDAFAGDLMAAIDMLGGKG